jgi:hypothetical protein
MNWLNPPELVESVQEVVPGFPDRIVARSEAAADELKTRTLTNLYNEMPTWLSNIHSQIDSAVADAYGWPVDIATDEFLGLLLKLNLERSQEIPDAG